MRKRETLKNTTNNSVYKKLLLRKIIEDYGLCTICVQRCNGRLYGGENLNPKFLENMDRSWKRHRKTQYKVK